MEKHSCLVMDKKVVLMSVMEDEHGNLMQMVCISKKRQKYARFNVNYCALCGGKSAAPVASIKGLVEDDKASS